MCERHAEHCCPSPPPSRTSSPPPFPPQTIPFCRRQAGRMGEGCWARPRGRGHPADMHEMAPSRCLKLPTHTPRRLLCSPPAVPQRARSRGTLARKRACEFAARAAPARARARARWRAVPWGSTHRVQQTPRRAARSICPSRPGCNFHVGKVFGARPESRPQAHRARGRSNFQPSKPASRASRRVRNRSPAGECHALCVPMAPVRRRNLTTRHPDARTSSMGASGTSG